MHTCWNDKWWKAIRHGNCLIYFLNDYQAAICSDTMRDFSQWKRKRGRSTRPVEYNFPRASWAILPRFFPLSNQLRILKKKCVRTSLSFVKNCLSIRLVADAEIVAFPFASRRDRRDERFKSGRFGKKGLRLSRRRGRSSAVSLSTGSWTSIKRVLILRRNTQFAGRSASDES